MINHEIIRHACLYQKFLLKLSKNFFTGRAPYTATYICIMLHLKQVVKNDGEFFWGENGERNVAFSFWWMLLLGLCLACLFREKRLVLMT